MLPAGKPLEGATVVLDPGHGGADPGTVGVNGIKEAHVNLAVAEAARFALEAEGISVVLTRTADYLVTERSVAAIVTALSPAAFVSIQHNGGPADASDEPGTSVFYQARSEPSRRLAGLLYEQVTRVFASIGRVGWHGGGIAGAQYLLDQTGQDYYAVLRETPVAPSALLEGLFLSASQAEADLMARSEVQRAEGRAVARAVQRFLHTDSPGSGFVKAFPPPAHHAAHRGNTSACVDPPLR